MDHIMTVRDVIEQLQGYDPDLPVMIGVCKYPEEMPTHNWLDHETSEVIAVEQDDISIHDNGGVIIFGCELADYSKERHFAGG